MTTDAPAPEPPTIIVKTLAIARHAYAAADNRRTRRVLAVLRADAARQSTNIRADIDDADARIAAAIMKGGRR